MEWSLGVILVPHLSAHEHPRWTAWGQDGYAVQIPLAELHLRVESGSQERLVLGFLPLRDDSARIQGFDAIYFTFH